jgi:hypothetical protein
MSYSNCVVAPGSELAALSEAEGRRGDAIGLLTLAGELYGQLKARMDLGEVEQRIGELQIG